MDILDGMKEELSTYNANRGMWEGSFGSVDCKWFAKPITPADTDYVSRYDSTFMANPSLGGMIELIIRKAETEDGTRVFKSRGEVVPVFKRIRADKVGEIFGALFGAQFDEDVGSEEYMERLEKN